MRYFIEISDLKRFYETLIDCLQERFSPQIDEYYPLILMAVVSSIKRNFFERFKVLLSKNKHFLQISPCGWKLFPVEPGPRGIFWANGARKGVIFDENRLGQDIIY